MTNSGKVARRCVGPGPAAYMLPSLTGYQGHDFSRYRNPAYTFKRKSGRSQKTLGPGPVYNIEHMTEYGKAHPPAYSIVSRRIPKVSHLDSGFGNPTYREGPNPPAYSIRGKGKSMRTSDNYPGPQKYSLPTVLGCHVPDKFSAPCYSIRPRNIQAKVSCNSPGPAAYGGTDTNIYKNKAPKYTMIRKSQGARQKCDTPGPASYLPKFPTCKNGLTMAPRTDQEPYILPDDELPCINK